ncbi:hypothetical protein [Parapedomonas caeni]
MSDQTSSDDPRLSSLAEEARAMRGQAVPPAAPPRTSSGWPWALTGLAIAFAAGLLGNPWFESKVRSYLPEALRRPAASADTSGLDSRLMALETRVGALEARPLPSVPPLPAATEPAGVPADTPAPAIAVGPALEQRLAAAEAKLAALEQAQSGAALQTQTLQSGVTALEGKLAQLSTRTEEGMTGVKAEADRARGFILLAGVRRALESGRAFPAAVTSLAALYGETNPDVAALRAVQAGGPTYPQLRARFRALAPTLGQTGTPAGGGSSSWWDETKAALTGLVQVRRAGEPAGGSSGGASAGDALVRADRQLAAGDLAGAIASVQSLPAPARTRAAAWLAQAQAHLAAVSALARLETAALAG